MNNTLQFSKTDYHKAVNNYLQNWDLIDKTLYSLCQKNYAHDSMNNIKAKLWIIGRTYATGIERKIKSNGYQGGSLSQLAQHINDNKKDVDDILKELKLTCNGLKLTQQKLEKIVPLHGRFVDLIKGITRNNYCPRSFVSKYMHFHCPVVPIYDSFAYRILNKFIRWNSNLTVFDKPKIVDEEYLWFALRFWELYKRASEQVDVERVKYLDYYLLCVADELNNSNN